MSKCCIIMVQTVQSKVILFFIIMVVLRGLDFHDASNKYDHISNSPLNNLTCSELSDNSMTYISKDGSSCCSDYKLTQCKNKLEIYNSKYYEVHGWFNNALIILIIWCISFVVFCVLSIFILKKLIERERRILIDAFLGNLRIN